MKIYINHTGMYGLGSIIFLICPFEVSMGKNFCYGLMQNPLYASICFPHSKLWPYIM